MIETHGLQYQYPGGEALSFADVAVPSGGTLLLQGPSGGGKSTWLSLVAGLRRPSAGSLTVAGTDLTNLGSRAVDAWRAANLGFLPQRLHLSESLTVAENLALVYLAAGQRRDDAAIAAALTALDVADLSHRKPAQLSGGQAQRVALARAVLLRPKVLLADEPTANLDDAAAHAALTLLMNTARSCGASCVVATHDARVRSGFAWGQTLSLPLPVFKSQLSNAEQTAATGEVKL